MGSLLIRSTTAAPPLRRVRTANRDGVANASVPVVRQRKKRSTADLGMAGLVGMILNVISDRGAEQFVCSAVDRDHYLPQSCHQHGAGHASRLLIRATVDAALLACIRMPVVPRSLHDWNSF